MAVLTAADVAAITPELWSDALLAEAERQTTFGAYEVAEGEHGAIVRKDDLTKEPGDQINMDLVMALTGDGIRGDTTPLEGNEEKPKFRQNSLTVSQLRHGTAYTRLADILSLHNKRTVNMRQLAKWLAGKIDDSRWAEFTGNTNPRTGAAGTTIPTANKWFAGSATSRATVADGDTTGRLTLKSISEARSYLSTEIKAEPLIVDGMEVYVLMIHDYAVTSLKINDANWAQAQREAQTRGDTNPLFTGAVGMWDGVIIRQSQRAPRSTNGTIQVADGVMFGANAMSVGYAAYPEFAEELFDYGQRIGHGTSVVWGEKLTVFDLTSAGDAADAAKTWLGGLVFYAAAPTPVQ